MAVTARTLQLAEDLRAAIGNVLDDVVRTLTARWARAWERIEIRFAMAVAELITNGEGQWPTRRQILASPRVNDALDRASEQHDVLVGLLKTVGVAAAAKAASAAGKAQTGMIASQLPGGHGRPTTGITDAAVDEVVRRAGQRITTLCGPLTREMRDELRRELIRGVAQGLDPDQAALLLVRRLEGAYSISLARALTIAHTEIMDAHREAARLTQAANADVLRGWIWIARLGRNTCPACWAMHGSEHPLDESGPNDHPNGKCQRAPLTKTWKELGFPYAEPESRMPDAQTTFRALSRADQLHIMGPGRLAALDRGDITWSDLARLRDNTGWRPSYQPVPLKDLIST